MSGVAGQEQVAPTHWFCHERAELQHSFFKDRAAFELETIWAIDAGLQFCPNFVFGPVVWVLVWIALEVMALYCLIALRDECKTPWGIGVDQLFGTRWCFGQNAEPSERIFDLVFNSCFGGDSATAE